MKQLIARFHGGPDDITAEALVTKMPISFLGGVNCEKGIIIDEHHELYGQSYAGKVLVYPFGKGSTGDAARLIRSKYCGVAPAAIINNTPDPIQVEGVILTDLGFCFGFDEDPVEVIKTGDIVHIKDGVVSIEERE